MLPASPKKQLTSIEPLKRLYVDQPLNANAESFPQEIKACGTLKGTQRWGSSAWVSRARLLLFRLRLSAAVAVTGPSATVAGMGAMGTAAAVRTTGTDTEVMFCRTCLDIMDRVTRTQPTPRGITGNFTHPRNSLRYSSNHPMRRHLFASLKQTTRHG